MQDLFDFEHLVKCQRCSTKHENELHVAVNNIIHAAICSTNVNFPWKYFFITIDTESTQRNIFKFKFFIQLELGLYFSQNHMCSVEKV